MHLTTLNKLPLTYLLPMALFKTFQINSQYFLFEWVSGGGLEDASEIIFLISE